MVAGSNSAHGRESPLQIVSNIYAIVPMAKSRRSFSPPEAIFIGNRSPYVQKEVLLNAKAPWANLDAISPLPHFGMRGDYIAGLLPKPGVKFTDVQVSLRREGVFNEPSHFCCWQISGITDFDMSDRFIAVSQHVNTGWFDAQIGALEDSSILNLSASNPSKNNCEGGDNKCGEGKNLIVKWLDVGGSERSPITPDDIKHGKALVVIAGIFCGIILFLRVWIG
jgi:hypothetical protein